MDQFYVNLQRDPLFAISLAVSMAMPPILIILSFWSPLGLYECPWKGWTGIPCVSCGMTRLFVFLSQGQLFKAFLVQPLGFIVLSLIPLYVPFAVAAPDWTDGRLSRQSIRTAVIIFLPLLVFNWFYLIVAGV